MPAILGLTQHVYSAPPSGDGALALSTPFLSLCGHRPSRPRGLSSGAHPQGPLSQQAHPFAFSGVIHGALSLPSNPFQVCSSGVRGGHPHQLRSSLFPNCTTGHSLCCPSPAPGGMLLCAPCRSAASNFATS